MTGGEEWLMVGDWWFVVRGSWLVKFDAEVRMKIEWACRMG